MIAVEGLRRVAVIVRTHVVGPKVDELLAALSGSALFDLFVLANETDGPLDFGPHRKLSHTLGAFEDMGFGPRHAYSLIHFSDLLLAHAARLIPGYDHYVLVEYDVHVMRRNSAFFDELVRALNSEAYRDVDLACVALRGSNPKWMWHAAAADFFEDVWACFFPVVCVSARALARVYERRMDELRRKGGLEARGGPHADNWVFCEAFLPSVVREAGYRMVDLNDIVPGAYKWSAFNIGPPWLLQDKVLDDATVELVHPVLEAKPFIEKRYAWAESEDRLQEFLHDLQSGRWSLPPELLQTYQARAEQAVAQLPEADQRMIGDEGPVRVAVFLRTHIDNAKVRESIATLKDGTKYDFYVLAHEEPGSSLDFGDVRKLSHSLQTFRDWGFDAPYPYFLMHCADLLFSFVLQALPRYDYYVLVEYDVLVQCPEDRFFDRLAEALTREGKAGPDLVATYLGPANPTWMWHAGTASVYEQVLVSFFPLVAMSRRAIPILLEERKAELERRDPALGPANADPGPDNWMFCEAFTPSALRARGGFVLRDLNGVIPGAYATHSFNVGPPRLLSTHSRRRGETEVIHPVVEDREFLGKGLFYHRHARTVRHYLSQLESGAWPVPQSLRSEFETLAREHLAEHPEPEPASESGPDDSAAAPPEARRRGPGTMPLYAQDDPLLPAVGVIAQFVRVGGPNIDAWRYWLADVEDKDEAGRYQRVLRDTYPIPDLVNREGYMPGDHIAFWLSGLADYLKTKETVARYGCTGGRLYEFGGGTGRVFRHFAAQSDDWEVWSSDFRLSSVQWNTQNYPPELRVFENTALPTLPLPDGYFDLVTAFSVFTHIHEAELQWLLELRRILKPGGIAYLSIHDETAWVKDDRLREETVIKLGLPGDAGLPPGKTVMRWREDDPYNCNVFHARDHIERVWGRFFEILEVKPAWVGAQAVVVCRRPS